MKYTALTSFLAATVAAFPTPEVELISRKSGLDFWAIQPLSTGSEIDSLQISASKGGLYLGLPLDSQDAVCKTIFTGADTEDKGVATFWINRNRGVDTNSLFLSTGNTNAAGTDADQRRVWVDAQGKTGYSNAAPAGSEFLGWKLSNVILTFKGKNLIACPNSIEGSWSVWVDVGVAQPGGNSGCVPFTAKPIVDQTPNKCTYTE